MKYVQIRAFHNVALAGGFSRAAEVLGLTQPAVSDQVLKLEQDYDILLFHRHRKRVSLTDAGRQLLEITRPMFEIEARAREFLSETRALSDGNLCIIADSAYHLNAVLTQFRRRFPKVRIIVRSGNSAEVSAALADYDADIGVLGNFNPTDGLDAVSLGTTPIVAFRVRTRGRGHTPPMSLHDLSREPLVLREPGSKTRQKLDEAAAIAGLQLTPAIEAEGREAVREIVASGAGIGFVSEAEFGQDTRLTKIPIIGPKMPMEETVCCLHQRRNVRVVRAFMSLAAEVSGVQSPPR